MTKSYRIGTTALPGSKLLLNAYNIATGVIHINNDAVTNFCITPAIAISNLQNEEENN